MALLLDPSAPKTLVLPLQPTEPVRLDRRGQYLQLSPLVGGLERVFYTVRHHADHLPDEHPAVMPVMFPLVWPIEVEGQECQQCFAGLESLILEAFQRVGVEADLTGRRPLPLQAPDLDALDDFPAVDRGVLDFVQQQDRGLILYSLAGRVHPARLIAQVALAWPKKRIVVAVTRIDDARRVARWLRHYGVDVTLCTGRHHNRYAGRVVVGTYSQIACRPMARQCQICLALNPAELFDSFFDSGIKLIQELHWARLYGLLADDARLAPRLRDLVTALFGVEEICVPRHGYMPVPVDVVFLTMEGGNRLSGQQSDYVLKQLVVHEHPIRNRRIRRLAQALADNDHSVLQASFPQVAAHLGETHPGRVGVLVDTIDHGLVLAQSLNWPLVAAEATNEQGLTEQQQAILERGRSRIRSKQPVVATWEGLARAGRFDVLIRADAGITLPAPPSTMLRQRHDKSRRLLLIDFSDRHHPLLRRWSRQRQEAYQDKGWHIVGNEMTPLDRFLASRPVVWGPGEERS